VANVRETFRFYFSFLGNAKEFSFCIVFRKSYGVFAKEFLPTKSFFKTIKLIFFDRNLVSRFKSNAMFII